MNLRSPYFFLPLIGVVIVLIVGAVVGVVYLRNITSNDITISWQAPSTAFPQQDRQDIQAAWKTVLLAPNSSKLAGHEFTIIDVKRQGDWAIFSANERVKPNPQPIPTEPLFFLAHLQGTTWTVWIPSSPGFCDELIQVPNTLLNSTGKNLFC